MKTLQCNNKNENIVKRYLTQVSHDSLAIKLRTLTHIYKLEHNPKKNQKFILLELEIKENKKKGKRVSSLHIGFYTTSHKGQGHTLP